MALHGAAWAWYVCGTCVVRATRCAQVFPAASCLHSGATAHAATRRHAAAGIRVASLACLPTTRTRHPHAHALPQSVIPRLVVFGGRGFVGSHICKEALGTGLHVVGISPSGAGCRHTQRRGGGGVCVPRGACVVCPGPRITHPPMHTHTHARAGTPPVSGEPWIKECEWIRGNVLEPQTYAHHLKGAVAAISCVGAFGSQEHMLRVSFPLLSFSLKPFSLRVRPCARWCC
jgi:hypothetical protein